MSDPSADPINEAPETPTDEEWQDLLGSGVILKKIVQEGTPDTRPIRSDRCLINLSHPDLPLEKLENLEIELGEGDVVQGLDVALGLMNTKETCLLKIGARLAYGAKGLPPHIPPDETVLFQVELVETLPGYDIDSLDLLERQRIGIKKRERGNWWYQRGENVLAVQCYRRALDYLDEVETDSDVKATDGELQKLLEDRLKVLNNMASAQIKMHLYDQAMKSLQTVLRCQPDNAKALFRKAKIHIAKNDLHQALKMLEKAQKLEPEDPLIIKEINTVNNQINKQKNREKEYARRMFGAGAPNTEKRTNKSNKPSRQQ